MKIHCCLFDKGCRQYGLKSRLHINDLFHWHIVIALWPSGKTQSWNPYLGYTQKWRWITIRPDSNRTCVANGGPRGCGRLANHRGPHVTTPAPLGRNRNIKWRKNVLIFDTDGMKVGPQDD